MHLLPLTGLAWEKVRPLLEECKALGWTHLFHGSRDTPIGDEAVSHAVNELSKSLLQSHRIETPFCYLDLRRTFETRMSDLKIPKEVRAQLQSHDLGGVQMTRYNRFDFLDQKRDALERWQRYLLKCAKQAQATDPV